MKFTVILVRLLLLTLLAVVFIIFPLGERAFSQMVNLPKGIGGLLYNYRGFVDQTQKYNSEGDLEPLAKPLQKDFNGPKLLEGVGGSSLKQLARHLQRTDSFSAADNGLLNSLELGTLDGNVTGDLSAHIFGLGFGISKKFTMLIVAPYIKADVRTDITFSGDNNAQEIKQRLGSLAFEELQSGLDQASQITTNQIKDSIEKEGYAPLDQWSHSGMGDLKVGGVYGFNPRRVNRNLRGQTHLSTFLNLPTGYVEDPDILTDVSLGKGYYSLETKAKQGYTYRNRILFGGEAGFNLNLPTSLEKRVPEQSEAIIAADRKTKVDLTPGQDLLLAGSLGVKLGLFTLKTKLGRLRHFKDKYSGTIEGNYDKLAESSNKSQTFVEFSSMISTVELFQEKRFAIPLVINAKYHMPIEAVNSIDDRYFEIALISFFKTPMAKSVETGKSKKKSKRKLYAKKKKKLGKKSKRELLGHH